MMTRPARLVIRLPLAGRVSLICKTAVRLIGGLLVCFLYSPASHAGSFQVNPVRLELAAQEKTAVVRVLNTGDETVTIQSQLLAWSQQDGIDLLVPTREVLVSPPIFKLKPGATQIVRVGLLRQVDDHRELCYRLQIEEIPSPPAPDFKGLQVALRIGMPVFVKSREKAAQDLHFSVSKPVNGNLDLSISNQGNAHAQLYELTIQAKEGQTVAAHKNSLYILPGQRRSISFKNIDSANFGTDDLLVKVRTRAGSLESHAAFTTP